MNKSTALESAGQHGVEVRPLSGMRDYTWGALVFAVEVALWSAAVAVGYHWGAAFAGPAAGVLLGVVALAVIGGVWGRWMSPKARRRLRLVPRIALGVCLIVVAAAGASALIGVDGAIGCVAVSVPIFALGQRAIDGKA
ncbi:MULTISPECIES: DUF2568 domain-containing protein [Gordonia]|uniref:DUF2568 domain-containing protein n=1 Tax=Gordonia sputi NBRC 100414 TaxID=1089453 RepID=H5U471_9ACTN|nr:MULTISPECIES: DUF2568 domain-containing protein [Gordonia]NKY92431.1 YrdB family protein [Gordonia sputi]OBA38325.1 DUF2568 domain-containing protein [Gordonia sp. 852002-51296_SCH5728562-b]GAB40529.1 hypothetical protein GOSPT_103_01060 [Gordonia sputi NBRC 100414]